MGARDTRTNQREGLLRARRQKQGEAVGNEPVRERQPLLRRIAFVGREGTSSSRSSLSCASKSNTHKVPQSLRFHASASGHWYSQLRGPGSARPDRFANYPLSLLRTCPSRLPTVASMSIVMYDRYSTHAQAGIELQTDPSLSRWPEPDNDALDVLVQVNRLSGFCIRRMS
jgi:hypothetical protein